MNIEGTWYVVDVYIPVAVEVLADNPEQAADMAAEMAVEQGVVKRVGDLVNEDFDTSFVISDSELKTEVGEA